MNQKNVLKVRQICFLYLALLPVTKLSIYPCFLAKYSGNELWVSSLLGFALDILIVLAALHLSKKHSQKTLYSIVNDSLGAVWAKVIFFVYALFFFFKAGLPLIEQKNYIENTLYELMPSPFIFYPFFILSVYACLKGLKIFGRIADLAVFITAAGLILALALTIPAGDFTNLLPIFQKPAYKLINGTFRSILWHSDGVYMFMFLGHFKEEKGYCKKIILSFVGAAVASLLFVCTYFAIYGPIAESQTFALPTMTVFFISATNVGRFDFLSIFLLLFSQVFAIIFPLFAAVKCLERVFGLNSAVIPTIAVNALMLVFTVLFGNKLFTVLDITTNYLSYFLLFVSVAITALTLILPRRKNEVIKG